MPSSSGPAIDFSVIYRDDDGFRAFWQTHAFRHQIYANRLSLTYGVQPYLFDMMDVRALDDFMHQMRTPGTKRILSTTAWLLAHSEVHAVELQTIGIGSTEGLTTVDFEKESDFYDWMSLHQSLHDLEDQYLSP